MFKRLTTLSYLAALVGGSLLGGGCSYGLGLDSWPRILLAILNEELLG